MRLIETPRITITTISMGGDHHNTNAEANNTKAIRVMLPHHTLAIMNENTHYEMRNHPMPQ